MRLVVGLGNPGPRYQGTRHNAGFLVVDELARRQGESFRKARGEAETASWGRATLLKPTTFMNLSGKPIQGAMARSGIRPAEILVIHDDLDLPLGRLRFKRAGGAGGQKGVQDTIDRIGPDFLRLKVGISRPPAGWKVENWVLSRFRDDERDLLERVVAEAADAVEELQERGLEPVMNRLHGIDLAAPPVVEPDEPPGEPPSDG